MWTRPGLGPKTLRCVGVWHVADEEESLCRVAVVRVVVRDEELERDEGEGVPHRQRMGPRPCPEGAFDLAEPGHRSDALSKVVHDAGGVVHPHQPPQGPLVVGGQRPVATRHNVGGA